MFSHDIKIHCFQLSFHFCSKHCPGLREYTNVHFNHKQGDSGPRGNSFGQLNMMCAFRRERLNIVQWTTFETEYIDSATRAAVGTPIYQHTPSNWGALFPKSRFRPAMWQFKIVYWLKKVAFNRLKKFWTPCKPNFILCSHLSWVTFLSGERFLWTGQQ